MTRPGLSEQANGDCRLHPKFAPVDSGYAMLTSISECSKVYVVFTSLRDFCCHDKKKNGSSWSLLMKMINPQTIQLLSYHNWSLFITQVQNWCSWSTWGSPPTQAPFQTMAPLLMAAVKTALLLCLETEGKKEREDHRVGGIQNTHLWLAQPHSHGHTCKGSWEMKSYLCA